ncbi:putative dicarboxylate carrier protein [Pseudonocardia sp. Ae406_Ps2]|nr:putative dicarboxylate carrier protein [Pseudonocardia sp. Ae406_Ps2]OLM08194.1 putative dicarboxylate carrier protein [Pseudonocardia sp. Ae331_Ps2]OLM13573.1 putative dicarboxylate carrier protein [Pseudonocardia sp. Ae505_Ps2]OLM21582.1 putative dicarboxylate carrier protein [Pseudonocardia sp. Ae706_Ps2]
MMSPQLLSILVLAGMFVVATMLPINIGILAFVASFVVGTFALGLDEKEIFEGFPVSLFITVVGVTYLFSVAKLNGTIDLLVDQGIRLVRGRAILVPWVLFAVAAVLTALGTFTPAAVALLVPIGMNFAFKYRISPLMIGMMVICGAHAGAFSPMAVSGALVFGIVADSGLAVSQAVLFFASLAFNALLGAITYLLLRNRGEESFVERPETTDTDDDLPTGGGGVATLVRTRPQVITWQQRATLVALVGLVVGALAFHLQIGFLALAAGAVLALLDRENLGKAIDGISWPTILLVAGMVTYVGVLEHAGTIEWVSEGAVHLGAPLLVALVLCLVVGITSAFASSTAILTAVIPMAIPLLLTGSLPAAGVIAAMAISTTIVDVSPFSTNGALVLANARGVDRTRFYRQVITYTCGIVALGPLAAWAVLVLPGAF